MTINAPKPGTRISGLLNRKGDRLCLSFSTVTAHTYREGERSPVGFEVLHDGGEAGEYRLSTYGDFWDRVTDHKVSALDVQPVRGQGWQSRFGSYPIRETAAEAVEDARAWWTEQAIPRNI